ncbi:MAG: RHS repeat-associated core domain-containing protein [Coriobacteriia bacterium]|nr:RHS repeat-associated core domain-containing protein [Coriobacteriia bacterium]
MREEKNGVIAQDPNLFKARNDLENRLEAVHAGGTLLFAALYDGDSNRIFSAQRNADITDVWEDEADSEEVRGGASFIANRWQDFIARLEYFISEFWYGFGQGVSQICANGAHVSRMLYLNWDDIARRYYTQPRTESEAHDSSKAERTHNLADSVFIPAGITSATRLDYELTTYVNDVNVAHTRTLAEIDSRGQYRNIYEYGAGTSYVGAESYGDSYAGSGILGPPAASSASVGAQGALSLSGEFTNAYGSATPAADYGISALLAHTSMGTSASTTRQMYAFDGRGSVAHMTDMAGFVQASYRYDTFGDATVSGTTTNPYAFNGERVDRTTGLQYLRARYLDMGAGRFITQDTYLGTLTEPLSQNRFTYTLNDPLNYMDPSGYIFLGLIPVVIGGMLGSAAGAWLTIAPPRRPPTGFPQMISPIRPLGPGAPRPAGSSFTGGFTFSNSPMPSKIDTAAIISMMRLKFCTDVAMAKHAVTGFVLTALDLMGGVRDDDDVRNRINLMLSLEEGTRGPDPNKPPLFDLDGQFNPDSLPYGNILNP